MDHESLVPIKIMDNGNFVSYRNNGQYIGIRYLMKVILLSMSLFFIISWFIAIHVLVLIITCIYNNIQRCHIGININMQLVCVYELTDPIISDLIFIVIKN